MKHDSDFRRALLTRLTCGLAMVAVLPVGCSDGSDTAAKSANVNASASSSSKSTAAEGAPAKPAAAKTDASSAQPAGNVAIRAVSPEEFKNIVASHKGRVVLADFWATYCIPCREKFPRTLALAKKYADQGLTVISMSMDSPDPDDQRKVRQFLEEQHSQITNLANRLEDPDKAFGALDIEGGALPHYKIFGRKGNMRKAFGGDPDHPFSEKDIEAEIVAALAEK